MKGLFALLLLLQGLCEQVNGQTDQQRINDLDKVASGGQQQMFGKPMPPSEVEGSSFYSDEWYLGDITFYSDKIYKEYFMRLDIASGLLETKKGNQELTFRGEDIQEFRWYNDHLGSRQIFVNCKQYQVPGTPMTGFFELVTVGEVALLAYPVIDVRDPDYVEGLDVGNRNYELRKKEQYYFVLADELFEIKKSKGKNIKLLKDRFPNLKSFVQINDLSFKERPDLIRIAEYLSYSTNPDGSF